MTFSDSRIVKALQEDWMPVWEAVSPVKEVTFELGEGRTVKGTVGGEIALYFCDERGKVFDIFPALQSPAATLKAIREAKAFYDEAAVQGLMGQGAVELWHKARMRAALKAKIESERLAVEASQLTRFGGDVTQVLGRDLYATAADSEAKRELYLQRSLDAATRDFRTMALSKTLVVTPSEGSITVVEPGGRGYYRWQVDRAFLGLLPDGRENKGAWAWNASLKEPEQWEKLLFEGVLHQPLGGGKFVYDSDSLEALSIVGE